MMFFKDRKELADKAEQWMEENHVAKTPLSVISYLEATGWLKHDNSLPSAQPEQRFTIDEVAEMLTALFGDDCACNYNDIDEWLPERCKYSESTCPEPTEKFGCWKQYLLQGGMPEPYRGDK